ncbi:MAG: biotin--[acetyl-CoA-carboxylase] ligase [Cryobacterium sp.]|nr:biotin--[acetyl-CoA-carboxylase] ligase [Cryobacterium sp.]
MNFELTRALYPELKVVSAIGSTNDELAVRAGSGPFTDFGILATLNQTSGRGRLDRSWITPPGKGLAVSVLLSLEEPAAESVNEGFGWIALAAGLAMVEAVNSVLSAAGSEPEAKLKWPNDVLIRGSKVCGLLGVLAAEGRAVVIGAGLNLTASREELPVATATSLALNGVEGDAESIADRILVEYLAGLQSAWKTLNSGTPEQMEQLKAQVRANCATIGARVRVDLPGGMEVRGIATGLDETGRLQLQESAGGELREIAAGDVTHLRYE